MVRAPEIYSLSKFPVFDTTSFTVIIVVCIRPLDLFILHNCNLGARKGGNWKANRLMLTSLTVRVLALARCSTKA